MKEKTECKHSKSLEKLILDGVVKRGSWQAMVVHRLWADGKQDLMIMPGSIPLYDSQVKSELVRYLPAGWEPVF